MLHFLLDSDFVLKNNTEEPKKKKTCLLDKWYDARLRQVCSFQICM